jgi:hypothetical protein
MSLETKEELIANVKEWIKIDAEIATFKSEIKNRLAKKKILTDRLVVVMKKNEIECFDINGGAIVYKKTVSKRAINAKMLLATLNDYYKESNNPQLGAEISQFILNNREITTKETITRKMEKV